MVKRIFGDDRARLLSKIDQSGGPDACWPFTGAKNAKGYGNFWLQGHYLGAHRAAWLLMVGDVPEGIEVDHVCHNEDPDCAGGSTCPHRKCANWKRHLRLATHKQNGHAGRTCPVDHCLRGHRYDEVNTYWHRGKKFCRACRRVEDPEAYRKELELKRIEAVKLRTQGMTFEQIAKILGYANRSAARNAIQLQQKRGHAR